MKFELVWISVPARELPRGKNLACIWASELSVAAGQAARLANPQRNVRGAQDLLGRPVAAAGTRVDPPLLHPLLVEAGEVGLDGSDAGFFVVGVVDAEAVESVQGVLPVLAGRSQLVQGMVGVGKPVVGAGLVMRLVECAGQRERLVVVGDGRIRMPGCVLQPAKALQGLELPISVADLPSEGEEPLKLIGGLRVPSLQPVREIDVLPPAAPPGGRAACSLGPREYGALESPPTLCSPLSAPTPHPSWPGCISAPTT